MGNLRILVFTNWCINININSCCWQTKHLSKWLIIHIFTLSIPCGKISIRKDTYVLPITEQLLAATWKSPIPFQFLFSKNNLIANHKIRVKGLLCLRSQQKLLSGWVETKIHLSFLKVPEPILKFFCVHVFYMS